MKGYALPLTVFAGLIAMALLVVNGASTAGGIKQQLSKEKSLSVTATAAAIDTRQPQHLKTATFALG